MKDNFLIGVYDDEEKTLDAVERVNAGPQRVVNVYSPFPIHGIDQALGYKNSRLPMAGFLFGLSGFFFAVFLQVYTMTFDWPTDIGGKPFLPAPSFVPVCFELTVLVASLGMVGTYFYANRMAPGIKEELADIRQTDDRFVVVVRRPPDEPSLNQLRQTLQDAGALELRETELVNAA